KRAAFVRHRRPRHAAGRADRRGEAQGARHLRRQGRDFRALGAEGIRGASQARARARARSTIPAQGGCVMHKPVMLDDMLDWLEPKDKGVYIDGTFGGGGYSRAILKAADAKVFAIDRDPSTRAFAERLEREFPDRFVWLLGNFSDMCSLVAMHGVH